MVTKPVNVMLDILKKRMPDGTFAVGSPFERDKYKEIPKKVELYKKVYVPAFTHEEAEPGLMDDRGDRWSVALDLKDQTKRQEFAMPVWFRHESLKQKSDRAYSHIPTRYAG
jgi:hypothetical protein